MLARNELITRKRNAGPLNRRAAPVLTAKVPLTRQCKPDPPTTERLLFVFFEDLCRHAHEIRKHDHNDRNHERDIVRENENSRQREQADDGDNR